MLTSTAYPQLSCQLGNPDAPNTVYVTTDPSVNKLSLKITTNTDNTVFTPGQPTPPGEAGAATGSLLYLDLTHLNLSDAEFGALAFSADGWQFQPYAGTTQQVCMTPTASVTLNANPGSAVVIAVGNMTLANPPSGASVQLTVTCYRVQNITLGNMGTPINFSVLLQQPPDGQADLHQALLLSVPQFYVVNSIPAYPDVQNSLSLIFSPGPVPRAVKAGDSTAFTVSFVYAADQYGYGALTTPQQGVRFHVEAGLNASAWGITPNPNQQNPSWLLRPPPGEPIIGTGVQATVEFQLGNIVTNFQPGPTLMIVSYAGVPGYQDGSYSVLLEKVPHVEIKSFTAAPNPAVLKQSEVDVVLSWEVSDAGALTLLPIGQDVTGQNSFTVRLSQTTQYTLEADGLELVNLDNRAFSPLGVQVVPLPTPIFLRQYPGQMPGIPMTFWANSPDLIPFGTQPAPDPSVFASQYGKDFSNDVSPGQANLVYVRGMNSDGGNDVGRIWLYYTQSDLALSPQNWTPIGDLARGNPYIQIESSIKGQVAATNPPFLWTPPPLPGGGSNSNHYCLIAIAEYPPLSDPPQSPAPSAPMASWNDLLNYLTTHPNVVWRSTTDVSGPVPDIQQTVSIATDSPGGPIDLGVEWSNMPTDSHFSYSFPGPDAGSTINSGAQPITRPNGIYLQQVSLPAGYASYVIVNWYKGNTDPPAGASIEAVAVVPISEP